MSVAAPTRQAEALAKRPGDCPLCPMPIEAGDPIRPVTTALGWAHSSCADDYFDVYPEHDHNRADEAREEI